MRKPQQEFAGAFSFLVWRLRRVRYAPVAWMDGRLVVFYCALHGFDQVFWCEALCGKEIVWFTAGSVLRDAHTCEFRADAFVAEDACNERSEERRVGKESRAHYTV